ncbi:MAG: molybdopterin-dependent oxidoreductase [Anaerolineae bacterium]|nr:molybdopterin-dependent oxidoreductase [Anaerolineae bacterium]MDQ7036392.1 molybdopterin-dependent oxidoreductase [Anaerolineae bacterium]
MENSVRKPSIWMGTLIGALLTPPLMAIMFIGERFAGLPFLPFDFFNWIARVLPGGLLTFGIDSMVDTLIAIGYGDNLDSAAKNSEQLMALMIFWVMGIVFGTLFVAAMNRIQIKQISYTPGIIFGAIVGLPLLLISLSVNISSVAPTYMQVTWHILLYVGYGIVFGWAYHEITSPLLEKGKVDAQVQGIDRRQFMVRVGGASAVLTVVGAGLGSLLTGGSDSTTPASGGEIALSTTDSSNLPNADASVIPAPGTRPELTPVENHYRIDISSGLPAMPVDYTLPISGLVANEVEWTLDDIRAMPSREDYLTMACISNRIGGSLISTVKWTGVSFQHILEQIQPTEDAVALKITSVDNFDEYVSLDLIRQDERIMLAYAFDDAPLPLRNGYPLRIHIPDRYGMKQPKWITNIEVVAVHEPGYWVRRGWSEEAIVNATSVVDTVATSAIYSDDSGQMFVPIGGMAWAGDRGIARVEVSIDDGDWVEADLRDPISERTWTIWRYDWAFTEGQHTFAVRCYETPSDGQSDPTLQITTQRGVRPDGATGIHAASASVRAPEEDADTVEG